LKRLLGFLLLALLLTSCKDESRQTLSDEQNKLSLRFFAAVRKGEHAAAADQANKLYLLNPGDEFLLRLAAQQKSNAVTAEIQQSLDRGDLAEANAIVDRAIKEEPFNRQLAKIKSSLRQLERNKKAIAAMKNAKSADEKTEALRAAKAAVGNAPAPGLKQYLDQYERQLTADNKP